MTGGRYGLDLRQSQPTGTVSGTTLRGQRCAALVYGGFESLSAVGTRPGLTMDQCSFDVLWATRAMVRATPLCGRGAGF